MRKLDVFNQISLDGYFADANGDVSWAHVDDPEWNAFVAENASGEGELLLGKVTYDLMAGYWPTTQAIRDYPAVAKRINGMPKVVFSRTLESASWSHTRLVKGDLAAEVRRLKEQPGPDMTILGSGSIVSQLSEARLIDEYQIVVYPVVLGKGRTMFEGIEGRLALRLTKTRTFGNGNVLLHYEPVP